MHGSGERRGAQLRKEKRRECLTLISEDSVYLYLSYGNRKTHPFLSLGGGGATVIGPEESVLVQSEVFGVFSW